MADTMYDKAMSMGWRYGGKQGITVPATVTDYVNRRGGAFVKISAGIARVLASTDTTVSGWICMGKETTANTSQALSSNDHFVITDRTAVFEMPAMQRTASLAASLIGAACFIDDYGSSTTAKQYARLPIGTTATPVLLIRDIDTENKTVFVSMNPDNISVT